MQPSPSKSERTTFLAPFVCNMIQGLPSGVIQSCMLGFNFVIVLIERVLPYSVRYFTFVRETPL